MLFQISFGHVLATFLIISEITLLGIGIYLTIDPAKYFVQILVIGTLLILLLIGIILLMIDRRTKVRKIHGYLTLLSTTGQSVFYKLNRARTQKWQISGFVGPVSHIDIKLQEDALQTQAKVFVSIYGTDGFPFWSGRQMDEEDEIAVGPQCKLVRSEEPYTQKASFFPGDPTGDPLESLRIAGRKEK